MPYLQIGVILFALLGSRGLDEPVFSGPQVGEKLTPFTMRGVYDDVAGKELDLVAAAGGKPILLVFVHEANRPSIGITRVLMDYGARAGQGRSVRGLVWLAPTTSPRPISSSSGARHACREGPDRDLGRRQGRPRGVRAEPERHADDPGRQGRPRDGQLRPGPAQPPGGRAQGAGRGRQAHRGQGASVDELAAPGRPAGRMPDARPAENDPETDRVAPRRDPPRREPRASGPCRGSRRGLRRRSSQGEGSTRPDRPSRGRERGSWRLRDTRAQKLLTNWAERFGPKPAETKEKGASRSETRASHARPASLTRRRR